MVHSTIRPHIHVHEKKMWKEVSTTGPQSIPNDTHLINGQDQQTDILTSLGRQSIHGRAHQGDELEPVADP